MGGGPTGAALAGDLGQRGRSVLLLEQYDGIVRDARLHTVNIRTMELARRWGIAKDLRNCGWPLDHPQDVAWRSQTLGDNPGQVLDVVRGATNHAMTPTPVSQPA